MASGGGGGGAAPPNSSMRNSKSMPAIALGTAAYPWGAEPEATRAAVLRAIELGYRHVDTVSHYQSERPVGEAIGEALRSGAVNSLADLFVTSKLWCTDARADHVLPALRTTLQKLQLDYLDLYLIHFPVGVKPKGDDHDLKSTQDQVELLCPIDISSVWKAMEECHALGLTKSIGVSNFSCIKLETLLSIAKVPPAVNQARSFSERSKLSPLGLAKVEIHPLWRQKKLREFCKAKGIQLCAYSPLGGIGDFWGQDWVMKCNVLNEIAAMRGKTTAQICLRWVIEQGDCLVVKCYNEKWMLENLDIFDWELTEEDRQKISQITQCI